MKIIGLTFTISALLFSFNAQAIDFNNTYTQQEYSKTRNGYSAVHGYNEPGDINLSATTGLSNNANKIKKDTNAHVEGFYSDNGHIYYRNGSGYNVTGWQFLTRDDGVDCWYYFDDSGVMTTGFKTIDGQLYYFKDDGTLTHSEKLKEIDGLLYSFSNDGHANVGWQSIDGNWYYFDRYTGDAFESNVHGIEGDDYIYIFWDDYLTRKDGSMGKRGSLVIGDPYEYVYSGGDLRFVVDENGHALKNQNITVDRVHYSIQNNGEVKLSIFDEKVKQISDMFPENACWNHTGNNSPLSYTWGGGTGNMFDSSWQCNGFAKYLYYYVYGEVSTNVYEVGAPYITIDKVRVGDYVALNGPYSPHSIFITDTFEENGITYWEVAREVWGGSDNKIVSQTYMVNDITHVKGLKDGRMYTIKGIRRASNDLRNKVGLSDAPAL